MVRPHSPQEIIDAFLDAYRQGAFPMAELPESPRKSETIPFAKAIHWYRPDPRAILPLDDDALHIPHGVKRVLKKSPFRLTSDHAFEQVIRACARPTPARGGAWLDESLIRCYTLLHQAGHAHSIEAWSTTGIPPVALASDSEQRHGQDAHATLLGGIYGLSIGAAFFAESMFTNLDLGSGASSICLVTLWNHLRACGYELLDVQIANDHTLRFGVTEIPLNDYLARLDHAAAQPDPWRSLPIRI